jgi:hypothetical protein
MAYLKEVGGRKNFSAALEEEAELSSKGRAGKTPVPFFNYL